MKEIFVGSEGAKLWTISTGEGIPVMLCSGGPGCCDYLAPVAEMIDDIAQVIRFEQRGCGRSEAALPYDVKTCVEDLENIRKHYELDKWIIGGHSWGAELALAYSLAHPDRVMGILCIAGGRYNNDREWHKVYRRGRDAGLEALPEFDYPPNLEVNDKVNASWKQYIQKPDLLKSFSTLDVPTLFVYGEDDIRPRWPIEQLAKLMPQAKFQLIPHAPHYLWFTHPEALRDVLREFICGF